MPNTSLRRTAGAMRSPILSRHIAQIVGSHSHKVGGLLNVTLDWIIFHTSRQPMELQVTYLIDDKFGQHSCIPARLLADVCRAVNVDVLAYTEQLHHKPMWVSLAHEPGYFDHSGIWHDAAYDVWFPKPAIFPADAGAV
jgi:hypothetical protein